MPNYKSIAEVINNEDALKNIRELIRKADVIEEFNVIFPDLKKIAKAVKIEKKVLFLSVENSVWRSELKFKQKVIIDKINNHFNETIIKSVKFIG
jgi:hypothetical protein